VQIRGQFSDYFFENALPAMVARAVKAYKAKKSMAAQFLNVGSTGRDIVQYGSVTGVGLPTVVGEGEDTPTDTMVQGYNKTFRPTKIGLGIACSQEMIEDDRMGIVANRSVALSNSIFQCREIQGASVYNNAFDGTNYAGPDGKALCASDHPLVKAGGTQSNILSVAADLDVASLELALTDYELIKTHEGFLQLLEKPRVLVAAQNRWNMSEILKSQMRSDTANNTRNAFQDSEQGGAIEGFVWAQLTDPDAWFLVAPPSQLEVRWIDRKAPYTKADYVEKNETGYLYMRYRADYGFNDWTGVYGTPGA
jgi:hypothetical protein